jgi:hypothetical protein
LYLVGDLTEVDLVLIFVSDDKTAFGMLFSKFAHSTTDHFTKIVENIGQEDEFLGVEKGRGDVVEEFGALDSDSNAGNFVVTRPKFGHFLIKPLQLSCKFFR